MTDTHQHRAGATDDYRRRRTFAIISHPDAGKTTLTEKLLLFGGAIRLAGQVKARGDRRRAHSDWLKIEQQRGISVTSSAMTFEWEDHVFNLLDTPGHEDFCDDGRGLFPGVDGRAGDHELDPVSPARSGAMIGETEAGPEAPTHGDEDLLTRSEASAFLAQFGIRLKPSTLARLWSTGGDGPPCRHVRSRPHYPRGLLREWARSQITDIRTAAPSAARGRRRG